MRGSVFSGARITVVDVVARRYTDRSQLGLISTVAEGDARGGFNVAKPARSL